MLSCLIVCNLTTKYMLIFWVGDQTKAKLIESLSDVTCQWLGHIKCDKVCDTDTYNKHKRESTNF